MNMVDIFLLAVLVAAFIMGYLQGVVRGLLAIAAWAVAFLLAANLREPLGSYLASQWTNLSLLYVHMLAFALIAVLTLLGLLVMIRVGTRGPKGVTSLPMLDGLMAGLLGVVFAVLVVAATFVILSTFHGPIASALVSPDGEWSLRLYVALQDSMVGKTLIDLVIPVMDFLFRPLTPQGVRDALG